MDYFAKIRYIKLLQRSNSMAQSMAAIDDGLHLYFCVELLDFGGD